MKNLNVLTTPVECPMAYSYVSFLFVKNSILMVSSKKNYNLKLKPTFDVILIDKICLPLLTLLDILNNIFP